MNLAIKELTQYDLPPHIKNVMKKSDGYISMMKSMNRTVEKITLFAEDYDQLDSFVKLILVGNERPFTLADMTYRGYALKKVGHP